MKNPNQSEPPRSKLLTRRNFLILGGGALVAAAGTSLLPGSSPTSRASAILPNNGALNYITPGLPPGFVKPPAKRYSLVGTDGWISLPSNPVIPFHPDPNADASTGKTTYVFGFRNVTGLTSQQVLAQKGKAQNSAPLLWVDQEADTFINLTNLGLKVRPDLTDGHTIHWHGFRDAIPLFDGVPEMSIAVPETANFTYYYHPRDPGTYMYHCHYEDVEHVQMGMVGIIFVRPAQNQGNTTLGIAKGKYAYNDMIADHNDYRSTYYDREFSLFLNELNAEAHYDDAHIQLFDWSEYKPDFWLMNGRCYPDTLLPNLDPLKDYTNAATPVPAGISRADAERLKYQPLSSLITANAGDKVLLRFVNLGYEQHDMTLAGIPMRVVGRDAVYMKGRDGTSTIFTTNDVYIGPGESHDAIFTAPAYQGLDPAKGYDTYLLYNRKYASLNNGGMQIGGQLTEIRVYPAGTLPAQNIDTNGPNT